MQLLEKDFEKRLGFNSFSDIKQHRVFQEIDWTKIANKNVEVLSHLPHKDFQSDKHDYFVPDYYFVSPTLCFQKHDDKTQIEQKANELLKKYGFSVKAEITCSENVHRVSCPINNCKSQGIKGIRVMKQKDTTGVILANYERHIKKMHVKNSSDHGEQSFK